MTAGTAPTTQPADEVPSSETAAVVLSSGGNNQGTAPSTSPHPVPRHTSVPPHMLHDQPEFTADNVTTGGSTQDEVGLASNEDAQGEITNDGKGKTLGTLVRDEPNLMPL